MTITDIAGPPPESGPALHDWLAVFWEHHASLQADAAERDRCEDEAWKSSRLASALRREQARSLAQQEAA